MFQRIPVEKTPKRDSFANPVPAVRPEPEADVWPASPEMKTGKIVAGFSDLVINGHISGEGELMIDGTVNGNIQMTHLVVGTLGHIVGNIEADTLEVRGRVIGNIFAREVRLAQEAFVEGDISFDKLAVDPGAYFQGRCLQTRALNIRPTEF